MRTVVALLIAALLPSAAVTAAEPQPFVRGSWERLVAAHRGTPTIAHFWGVTCGPCLVELPEWAGFRKRRPDIDVVMIEADPLVDTPADLAAPLVKAGLAGVENWHFADAFAERLEYEVDPQWRGELPYTLLIRGDGTTTSVTGAVDFAALANWLIPGATSPGAAEGAGSAVPGESSKP